MSAEELTQDEATESTQDETTEETQPAAVTASAPTLIDGRDPAEMSQEEILAILARRRAELTSATKVAKERGIKVPTTKTSKPKVSDAENLERLFNRLGYSTGMRRWADGRMDSNGTRIQDAVTELGEAFQHDPERLDACLTALAEGFREAKIQTSFSSDVMKTKEEAKDASVASILPEALQSIGDKGWGFLEIARQA